MALELKEQALKKNNIKKAPISNAKNQQYKTALKSLETVEQVAARRGKTVEEILG